ncbi:MAG: hypothetical protein OJF52_001090 [Nitrospira sp.]|jgi:hypothetical protein|nr:MAG: hypothetical protein OJF52_001090 [Nitrospira sp.]
MEKLFVGLLQPPTPRRLLGFRQIGDDVFPELSHRDVTAALEYASQVVDEENVIPRA